MRSVARRFTGGRVGSGRFAAGDVAGAIGAGRLVIGGALLAAPTPLTRALGVDSASAKRMAFVTRVAAVRDIGLGVGTLATRGTAAQALWVAVGAVADAGDAVFIAGAARQGVVRRGTGLAAALGAAAVAAAGGWAAATARG